MSYCPENQLSNRWGLFDDPPYNYYSYNHNPNLIYLEINWVLPSKTTKYYQDY